MCVSPLTHSTAWAAGCPSQSDFYYTLGGEGSGYEIYQVAITY